MKFGKMEEEYFAREGLTISDKWKCFARRASEAAKLRADIAGRPVEIPSCIDSAPVGAAMLAAVAGGLVADLATAAGLLGADARRIEPDRGTRAAYEAAYGDYRRLFASLTPLFTRESGV